MINGIIIDCKWEGGPKDAELYHLPGGATKYRWGIKPLTQTTTLTKKQYAEYKNIPAKISIVDEESMDESIVDNPAYTELKDSYTVPKYALIVGDDLAEKEIDEETGEVTITKQHEDVVDVEKLLMVEE